MVHIKVLIPFLFAIECFCSNCTQSNDKRYLNCYFSHLKEVKQTEPYNSLRNSFLDTFDKWQTLGIRYVQHYKNDFWSLDSSVFFNKDMTKALLLLVHIDSDTTAVFDGVKIIAGEHLDGNWIFYFDAVPMSYYNRNLNAGKPFDFTYLATHEVLQILKDGFIDLKNCEVNYSYVDSEIWFSDFIREVHQKFLRDRISNEK